MKGAGVEPALDLRPLTRIGGARVSNRDLRILEMEALGPGRGRRPAVSLINSARATIQMRQG